MSNIRVLGTSNRRLYSATLVLATLGKYLKSREIQQVDQSQIKVLHLPGPFSNPNPKPNPKPNPTNPNPNCTPYDHCIAALTLTPNPNPTPNSNCIVVSILQRHGV